MRSFGSTAFHVSPAFLWPVIAVKLFKGDLLDFSVALTRYWNNQPSCKKSRKLKKELMK